MKKLFCCDNSSYVPLSKITIQIKIEEIYKRAIHQREKSTIELKKADDKIIEIMDSCKATTWAEIDLMGVRGPRSQIIQLAMTCLRE
jgi:hypothetical protein